MSKDQLNLFNQKEKLLYFRPIHYLGSKLRLLDFIKQTIDDISNSSGRICDLFSGSGTVSYYLSNYRPVTAVDIQEYSKVLCKAMLKLEPNFKDVNIFLDKYRRKNEFDETLSKCLKPLLEHEKECMSKATRGELKDLSNLLEKGSIIGFEDNKLNLNKNELYYSLEKAISCLKKHDLYDTAIVTKYYGGLYFSYEQALKLDIILNKISELDKKNREVMLAATLSTASDIVNTVGKQFAQPIKPTNSDGTPKSNLYYNTKKDREKNVFNIFEQWVSKYLKLNKPKYNNKVYCMDYSNALKKMNNDVEVVYADPPYTRYHYSRYYHVLETMALKDNPEITEIKVNGEKKLTRGIYRDDRHQSPFSIKSRSNKSFNKLFKLVNEMDAKLVLSYSPQNKKSAPRIQTIDSLINLAGKYFDFIEVRSAGEFSHSKLNKDINNKETDYEAERLIVCK